MERLTEYVDGKYIRIKGTKSLYPKEERDGAPLSNAIARLAAYEESGLEPEELEENQNEAYDRGYQCGMNYSGRRWTEAFEIGYQSCLKYKGLRWDEAEELQRYREIGSIDRLRELAQADREGRVTIEPKARKCPKCGKMRLFPRIDWNYYYCYFCKTQFTREAAEAALEERERAK